MITSITTIIKCEKSVVKKKIEFERNYPKQYKYFNNYYCPQITIIEHF